MSSQHHSSSCQRRTCAMFSQTPGPSGSTFVQRSHGLMSGEKDIAFPLPTPLLNPLGEVNEEYLLPESCLSLSFQLLFSSAWGCINIALFFYSTLNMWVTGQALPWTMITHPAGQCRHMVWLLTSHIGDLHWQNGMPAVIFKTNFLDDTFQLVKLF